MADNRSFESTLHDIVYSIDTGTGLKIIRVSLYVLVLLVIMMIYTATQFRGLKTEESMDFAQLGRNYSFQNGLVTKYVRPLTMWKMASRSEREDPQIGLHPDLFHPPGYPIVLSAGFHLFDLVGIDPFEVDDSGRGVAMHAEQWVVIAFNNLFAILTGWLVFLLGKRIFTREIGFVGMTIYYLSDLVWRDSISGLNITMAGFFVMAAFYAMAVAMLNKRDGESPKSWIAPYILSILFAVAAFYTRYIALAIVPGLCLFAWLMGGRFRGGLRFVAIFIVLYGIMVSPWLVRNYKVSGNPVAMVGYSALVDTDNFPGDSLMRGKDPGIGISEGMSMVADKWNVNYTKNHPTAITGMGGGALMALFLVTFFYHFIRPQVNYLRWGVGVSLGVMAILAGFFSESSISMLHTFWPFVVLYAIAFFYILIDRLDLGVRLYNLGLKLLLVLIAALPFLLTLMPPHEKPPYPPYYVPAISKVTSLLSPREVMCSDMPWATAWYGDRITIQMPRTLDDFYEINDYNQYISGLYITTITKNKPFVRELLDGPEKSWLPVMSGRTPADFPLKEAISLLRQDQIFFSDRNRWGGDSGTGESAH
ncbi:MAG: glycosyltransferase family 39 protein [Pontiellaceae bacterium]|nr:glycosyltransferase family 39 protein [Pontiellaceae bacterium]MBN2786464.1 glycosyltransferase family 39 protein [Pontiellaceae bacterium]